MWNIFYILLDKSLHLCYPLGMAKTDGISAAGQKKNKPPKEIALTFKPVEKEGWKAFNAFESFLLLGPQRTLTGLAQVTNYKVATLGNWCKRYHWIQRTKELDAKCMAVLEADSFNTLTEQMKKKHLKMYQTVQARAMEHLGTKDKKKVQFDNSRDAALSLDVAIKGEREVAGLNQKAVRGAIVKEGFAALVELVTEQGNMRREAREIPEAEVISPDR